MVRKEALELSRDEILSNSIWHFIKQHWGLRETDTSVSLHEHLSKIMLFLSTISCNYHRLEYLMEMDPISFQDEEKTQEHNSSVKNNNK